MVNTSPGRLEEGDEQAKRQGIHSNDVEKHGLKNSTSVGQSSKESDFERQILEAVEIRVREGNSWRNKPTYMKLALILQACIVAVSFALSVWQGIERHDVNKAQIATAAIANQSLAVSNQSLAVSKESQQIAAQALEAVQKANNLTETANNLTAISNNLTAQDVDAETRGVLFSIYTYCLDHPESTMNFTTADPSITNCSGILATPFAVPTAPTTYSAGLLRTSSPAAVWIILSIIFTIQLTSLV